MGHPPEPGLCTVYDVRWDHCWARNIQNGLKSLFSCLSQGDSTGICHRVQAGIWRCSGRPGGVCWSVCLEGGWVLLAAWMEKVRPRAVVLLSKSRRLLLVAPCSSACKSQLAHAPCPAQMAYVCTKTRLGVAGGHLKEELGNPSQGQGHSLLPLPTLGQAKP